jgi:hypothetical protein
MIYKRLASRGFSTNRHQPSNTTSKYQPSFLLSTILLLSTMRFSAVVVALFATLTVALPSGTGEANALVERQCAANGVCSTGGPDGCSALRCCSNAKAGQGNGVSTLFLAQEKLTRPYC